MTNTVTPNANINIVQVTSPGPLGPRGAAGPAGPAGTITGNTGVNSTGSSIFSGSVTIIGTLLVTGSNTFINVGPAKFTGSVNISGSLVATSASAQYFSGSYYGSGVGLTDIPASAIAGFSLTRIATGVVSASVAAGGVSFTLNNGASNLFTVNSSGLGTFLNGLTVNGAVSTFNQGLAVNGAAGTFNQGLTVNNIATNLNAGVAIQGTATLNGSAILTAGSLSTNKITDSNISASVSSTGKAFSLNNNATVLASIDQLGGISGSGLYISGSAIYLNGPNISLIGNATLNGSTITTAASLATDRIQSGAVTASVGTVTNAFTVNNGATTLLAVSLAGGTSGSFTGSFAGDGSGLTSIPASGITGLNLSRTATGSVSASVNVGTTNFEIVSGSSSLLSLDYTGKLVVSKSVNAGIPTSNQWQSGLGGSYFNNFTSTSDVSEILRFIAGLLSASAPDASPNTQNFASISKNTTNTSTTTAPSGYIPQSYTTADLAYLVGKGFASVGSTLFSGKTIYNNSAYANSYTSVAGGSTIVSSSVDAQLFGLGTLSSGNATPFYVSGAISFFYSDNNSETVTSTSQSQTLLTANSFGTTNGLTIGKILTANPAVIPPAYQDGKFATVFSSGLYNGGRSFTSVSSSGWYHISASILIATGSSAYGTVRSTTDRIFWAPISSITIPSQTVTFTGVANNALTATSRSLSGAPYLLTSTFNFATTVNGTFNPLYTADNTIASSTTGDGTITLSGTSSVSTSGGTIQTATAVYDSTGVTPRATSTVPFQTDIIKLTGSAAFSAGNGGATNITSTSLGTTSFTLTHAGKDRTGATTSGTQVIFYHSASTFSQPATSGSMAYYGRTSQTYDGGSLTGQTEAFTGEAYRIQLTDAVTTFTGVAWNNAYGLYNLGAKDLQVKPGYLVRPGGTYKYWLTDPSPSDTFKYYVRRFQKTSVLTSFTLDIGKTLVAWDDVSTSNSVAVGIIFESAKGGGSNCRLFDPVYAIGSRGTTFSGGTTGTNPFVSSLDYYGAGGSVAGTTYTISVASATNMILNGTAGSDEIYVIIRYNGDPSPVTSLTVSGT